MDVNTLIEDKRFVKYVLNKCITCHRMMKMLDLDPTYDHNIYCPFHDNTDTPSARMYKNEDGSDSIFCYSEHKMYKSSDFITRGLVNARLESVFYKLWIQLTDEIKESLINSYNGDVSYVPEKFKELQPSMEQFKEGNISISELNQLLLESLR